MRLKHIEVRLMILSMLFLPALVQTARASDTGSEKALHTLKAEIPGVRVFSQDGQPTRIYGQKLGYGNTPFESAEQFIQKHARVFNVDPSDLARADSNRQDGGIGVMYNRSSQDHKFSLFRYKQTAYGIPVFRARLSLLMRNEPGFPLVMAGSSLRDTTQLKPVNNARYDNSELLKQAVKLELAEAEILRMGAVEGFTGDTVDLPESQLTNHSDPQLVVWAGTDTISVKEPLVAVMYTADNYSLPYVESPMNWLFVADIETGKILYAENRILFTNVNGNVSGNVTQGAKAMHCSPEAVVPFPSALVQISGGNSSETDANGDFTIVNSGSSAVTVQSPMTGTYFIVYNEAGAEDNLSMSVTPPGPADFIHNSANTSEYVIAQANGYAMANQVRDWALTYNPSFPSIGSETDFPVYVNRNDGYCPGNAWYDPSLLTINFCRTGSDADGSYGNTAFASVLQHEYGHHLIDMGGSGQGQYGEGMSDCVAMLNANDPGLGYGFYYDQCDTPLRNADNTMQYPCTDSIHYCGQLLSGAVWDTLSELAITYPTTYLSIVSNLAVNSILLHDGTQITPQICIDFLTLDDDDGNLDNGTPHSAEILAGFDAHNLVPQDPPTNDNCTSALEACPGPYSGDITAATSDGSASCGSSSSSPDVWYSYIPQTSGTATFSLCDSTNYDAVLSVHSACPGTSSNELGCDDDGCGSSGGPSTVTLSVNAAQTYLIRVTGYSGAIGAYTLTITGPDCVPSGDPLTVSLPYNAPDRVDPGAVTAFAVRIEDGYDEYATGSGMLHYRYDGLTYLTAPLEHDYGNIYTATLPGAFCSDSPEFYVSAQGLGGSTVTYPEDAPATTLSASVGIIATQFEEDFEEATGWTVENSVGLSDGAWIKGVPAGDGTRGDPTVDNDGSGQCYLTDNVAGNSDVDLGSTFLISPVFDLAGEDPQIHYALWYSNDTGGDPNNDLFKVHVSNNGGTSWVLAETIGPVSPSGWNDHSFRVTDFIEPTDQVRVRFQASDLDGASIVEAAVDSFAIAGLVCFDPSCTDGVLNQDETRIDCGGSSCDQCECETDAACDDTLYCNGQESCNDFGECQSGGNPCPRGKWCYEDDDQCLGYGSGHFDADEDVDLADFSLFQACFNEVGVGDCFAGNLVGSGIIDLEDFAEFIELLQGPN